MGERLKRVDCRTLGYCVEGFPRSENQYRYFSETLNHQPDGVFVLTAPDSVILRRMRKSKFDPLTGRVYSQEDARMIKQHSMDFRLVDLEEDSETSFKTRYGFEAYFKNGELGEIEC
jgi:adenylate kinase family enzyme